MTLPKTAILDSLKQSHLPYYAKLDELRSTVAQWLEYVPATFPHYTRHGVAHSDAIIGELSQLLFEEGDSTRPVVAFSGAELYILCAAAYLHDVGMVISEKDKAGVLATDAWRTWVTGDGGGAKRWAAIRAFRSGPQPGDESIRHFLADVQTRLLIAEFVRRVHHLRAAPILSAHHTQLSSFAFDDPSLLRTIADVCVAHGLETRNLEEPTHYPDRRTIRGEQVNVRFLATLLRIGDLLDISSARACPLLLSAASPLPPDSVGHWSQYQRVVHRVTSPDTIELSAECLNQDEHRLLHDWCSWLVQEVHAAQLLMARSTRHGGWTAPKIAIGGPAATITIGPAPGASYKPWQWAFELDQATVFQRLIKDVYHEKLSFVRELLQNALDATRTRLYADLRDAGEPLPAYPTQVPDVWRERYPIRIALTSELITNPLSGEGETRQVLSIEDPGIGMDSDTIRRYFLQVGRSFYTSKEFSDNYPFIPTSRFGIGFLSVFAVSDHVTVDTYAPRSALPEGPLKLTLTGPRAYLLVEASQRKKAGTYISVRLGQDIEAAQLERVLRHWCKRVEFPLSLTTGGGLSQIEPTETPLYSFSSEDKDGKSIQVTTLAFPVRAEGIEGHIFVPSYTDLYGESWAARYRVMDLARREPLPSNSVPPSNWVALHGIDVSPPPPDGYEDSDASTFPDSLSARLDLRTNSIGVSMERVRFGLSLSHYPDLLAALEPTYARILDEHLRTCPRAQGEWGWHYRQRLCTDFPLPTYWLQAPGLVAGFRTGKREFLSLEQAASLPRLGIVLDHSTYERRPDKKSLTQAASTTAVDFTIAGCEFTSGSNDRTWDIVRQLPVCAVYIESGKYPLLVLGDTPDALQPLLNLRFYGRGNVYAVHFPSPRSVYVSLERSYFFGAPLVLNLSNPYGHWLARIARACSDNPTSGALRPVRKLLQLFIDITSYRSTPTSACLSFLQSWCASAAFPGDLLPPDRPLTLEELDPPE